MFEYELETAVDLAREAGRSVIEHYALDIVAEEKIGIDQQSEPVTAADRAASRIIVDGLRDAFPLDGVLSEEETDVPDNRLAKSRVWIIDPIDGTWGFVKKDGDFAVQIGLAVEGMPVLGVVFVPLPDKLYYASKGDGAFLIENGDRPKRLATSSRSNFEQMRVAVSRNHPNPGTRLVNQRLGFGSEVRRGSIGIKVGLIVENECDVYINLSPRSKFWDTCGPQAILEEAGGKLTSLFGEPIRYDSFDAQNHNGIVASGTAAHRLVIRKLKPLLGELGRRRLKGKAA